MRRSPLGEVVEVRTDRVVIRLREYAKSAVIAHADGLSSVGQPGDLIGIDSGSYLLIARISTITMYDAGYAPGNRTSPTSLRSLEAQVIGVLTREHGSLAFSSDRTRLPALGGQAVGLTHEETCAVLDPVVDVEDDEPILLGSSVSTYPVPVKVGLNPLLARHFAVLGSSGQGKTHFVTSILQRLVQAGPRARIVIFDVHDEYGTAFRGLEGVNLKETVIGTPQVGDGREHYKIPYYALGRTGIGRLILPSEKTQRPALNFAMDKLPFVDGDLSSARLVGQPHPTLYDDCRTEGAFAAATAIQSLKENAAPAAQQWPPMKALSCLAAEWAALEHYQGNWRRSAFNYGNVGWMLQRMNRLIEDARFNQIVSTGASLPLQVPGSLSMANESTELIRRIFGGTGPENWNVHIVTLKQLPSDLAPHILGSLLELFAEQLFVRGPGNTHPTLLVLEEAHQYLREIPGDAETGKHALAYERLAREGRKFPVSMMISPQRPSEVSPTVLALCGSWAIFRLTNEKDQSVISSGTEQASKYATAQIPGLVRGQAVIFGDAMPLATKLKVVRPIAGFEPKSNDAQFARAWRAATAAPAMPFPLIPPQS